MRCVDTVAELDDAIRLADGEPVEIRLVRGTYDLADSCLQYSLNCVEIDEDLSIHGGYDPGCGGRDIDARGTILRNSETGFYDRIQINSADSASVHLSNLTIDSVGAGVLLDLVDRYGGDARIVLERVRVDRSGPVELKGAHHVFLNQVMVTRAMQGSDGVAAVRIHNSGNLETATISHVTIAQSPFTGLWLDANAGTARFSITNSILWGHPHHSLRIDGNGGPNNDRVANVLLVANTYANMVSILPLSVAPVETLDADPLFANPAAGDFSLQGLSTSINSGRLLADSIHARDLHGAPRLFSNRPDRGAIESAIGSQATTLVVTNTNESGIGSLRQAILDANAAPNFNRIHFAIGSTCGPQVIRLTSALPDITAPLHIDGYTQPGASRDTLALGSNRQLCIVLDGQGLASVSGGLLVPGSVDETVGVQVDGLAFSGFLISAMTFSGGSDHGIFGSQIGGNLGALPLAPSGYGIRVGYRMSGVTIGGSDPGLGNTIGGTTIAAIQLAGSGDNQPSFARIEGNEIGVAANGITAIGNERGIVVRSNNHTIRDNLIMFNAQNGIDLDGAGAYENVIQGNRIGVLPFCFPSCASAGNGGHGVLIRNGATRNLVSGNTIADQAGDGVAIVAANYNPVFDNAMWDNDGEGIDLGNDGLTANDNDTLVPPASAGNHNQNAPVLTAAQGGYTSGTVSGTLATANGIYRIDLYADDSCPGVLGLLLAGQGRYPLGSTFVAVSGGTATTNGTATFAGVPIAARDAPSFFATPRFVTATASQVFAAGQGGLYGRTSEFSFCIPYAISDVLLADGFE